MTEQEWKAEARLVALEYLVARTYNQVMAIAQFPPAVISSMEDRDVRQMGLQAIGTGDPAMSDYIAGEIQDALRSLLRSAREMRGVA